MTKCQGITNGKVCKRKATHEMSERYFCDDHMNDEYRQYTIQMCEDVLPSLTSKCCTLKIAFKSLDCSTSVLHGSYEQEKATHILEILIDGPSTYDLTRRAGLRCDVPATIKIPVCYDYSPKHGDIVYVVFATNHNGNAIPLGAFNTTETAIYYVENAETAFDHPNYFVISHKIGEHARRTGLLK